MKFFHFKVIARKRKNKTKDVKDNFGQWTKANDEVETGFCEYFQELFSTSSLTQELISAAFQGMSSKLTPEVNDQLDKPFTVEEITIGLFKYVQTKLLDQMAY